MLQHVCTVDSNLNSKLNFYSPLGHTHMSQSNSHVHGSENDSETNYPMEHKNLPHAEHSHIGYSNTEPSNNDDLSDS